MEVEKPKVTKARRNVDWKALAIYAGSQIAQGALVAIGGIVVHRGLQALSVKPEHLSTAVDDNVLTLKKATNS